MALAVDKNRCPQNHRCPMIEKCPVGAIVQQGYGLPIIDEQKCIQCGKCSKICGMNAVIDNNN